MRRGFSLYCPPVACDWIGNSASASKQYSEQFKCSQLLLYFSVQTDIHTPHYYYLIDSIESQECVQLSCLYMINLRVRTTAFLVWPIRTINVTVTNNVRLHAFTLSCSVLHTAKHFKANAAIWKKGSELLGKNDYYTTETSILYTDPQDMLWSTTWSTHCLQMLRILFVCLNHSADNYLIYTNLEYMTYVVSILKYKVKLTYHSLFRRNHRRSCRNHHRTGSCVDIPSCRIGTFRLFSNIHL